MQPFPTPALMGALQHLSWSSFQIGTELLGGAPDAEIASSLSTIASVVDVCRKVLTPVPLSAVVRGQLERLQEALRDVDSAKVERPDRLAYEFQMSLATEFESSVFLMVPSNDVRLYIEPIAWLEQEKKVIKRFPRAKEDVIAAGQCCALGQWDATVFHAVCVLDHGLVKLAKGIKAKVPPRAGWHELLTNIEDRIQALRTMNPRTKQATAVIGRYSDAAAQMHYFRIAWRNQTMHAQKHYTEAEARSILNGVKQFMRALA